MPLQNRVLPTGDIVVDPARGMFTGNRGIIHRPDGTLGTSRWSHKHWLVCTLDHPRGIYHGPMPDRGWSALFFLDEAVALAAGHRPCHYCRRKAYQAFQHAWAKGVGQGTDRMAMDTALHKARVMRTRQKIQHESDARALPDGAFILWDGAPHLVHADRVFRYETDGYTAPIPRPTGLVTVMTPRPTVSILRAGYRPMIHPTARL